MPRIGRIVLFIVIFSFIFPLALCCAEKIYLKEGRMVQAEVLYCLRGTVWVKTSLGAVGINMDDVESIENDDGSVSKYGYKFLSKKIENFIAQGNYQEASRLCGILLNSFPEETHLYYLQGLLSQKTGNLEQAVKDYNFLIKKGSAGAEVFNNLGAIYADRGEFKEAQGLFLQAVEKDPNLIDARYNLAAACLSGQDYEQARQQWEKILLLKPDDQDAKAVLEYLKTKNRAGSDNQVKAGEGGGKSEKE